MELQSNFAFSSLSSMILSMIIFLLCSFSSIACFSALIEAIHQASSSFILFSLSINCLRSSGDIFSSHSFSFWIQFCSSLIFYSIFSLSCLFKFSNSRTCFDKFCSYVNSSFSLLILMQNSEFSFPERINLTSSDLFVKEIKLKISLNLKDLLSSSSFVKI